MTLNFLWNAWKSKNDRMSGDKKFLRDVQTTNFYYDGFLKSRVICTFRCELEIFSLEIKLQCCTMYNYLKVL